METVRAALADAELALKSVERLETLIKAISEATITVLVGGKQLGVDLKSEDSAAVREAVIAGVQALQAEAKTNAISLAKTFAERVEKA